jgi:hypothetical protein
LMAQCCERALESEFLMPEPDQDELLQSDLDI